MFDANYGNLSATRGMTDQGRPGSTFCPLGSNHIDTIQYTPSLFFIRAFIKVINIHRQIENSMDSLIDLLRGLGQVPFSVRLGRMSEDVELEDGICARDVVRLCTGHSNIKRVTKYMASVKNHGMVEGLLTATWNGELKSSCTTKGHQLLVDVEGARRFVCFLLRRGFKSQDSIDTTLKQWGIEDRLFESAYTSMAEKDTLGMIARAIPFPSEQQFRIGKYRLDLYFPTIRIAVACNEFNHDNYDRQRDMERRTFVESQLNCRFVSFDPYAHDFSPLDVVSDIVRVLCDPRVPYWMSMVQGGPWGQTSESSEEEEEEEEEDSCEDSD